MNEMRSAKPAASLFPDDLPDPRQEQFRRSAQLKVGDHVEGLDVEVGLDEAVEEHQAVGAGRHHALC